jgi:hypothetical protein
MRQTVAPRTDHDRTAAGHDGASERAGWRETVADRIRTALESELVRSMSDLAGLAASSLR